MSMSNREIANRLKVMVKLASEAGQLAFDLREAGVDVKNKGLQDFVTDADIQVESEIVQKIRQYFPDDGIFAEENANTVVASGTWVIDPIDGTTNYASGSNLWAISLAWIREGQVECGAIFAADRCEVLSAQRNQGAFLNGKRLLSDRNFSNLHPIYLGWSNRTDHSDYLELQKRIYRAGYSDRKLGSAAISFAHVARGDACAFFEAHLNSWDCLAGLILCQEVGCETNIQNIDLRNGGRSTVIHSSCDVAMKAIFHD